MLSVSCVMLEHKVMIGSRMRAGGTDEDKSFCKSRTYSMRLKRVHKA